MNKSPEVAGHTPTSADSALSNVATSGAVQQDRRLQPSHGRYNAGNNQSRNHQHRPTERRKANSSTITSSQICRFFGTKKGCRAGDQCPYQHVQTHHADTVTSTASNVNLTASSSAAKEQKHATSPQNVVHRAPVAKPVSSLEKSNPREFQINQVTRRFAPFRADLDDSTTLKFRLRPSDPDFPFELGDGLHCVLTIPSGFPENGSPFMRIENAEMPRGFQINVEKGFDGLVKQYPAKTLLALLNELDKKLEALLTAEKAQTFKIVVNAKRQDENLPKQIDTPPKPQPILPSSVATWTAQELANAEQRRETETRQLEARMGRMQLFSKASDGCTFNVPLQIANPTALPPGLQSLKETILVVPMIYPLEPCTIMLKGVGTESENVEFHFEKHAKEHSSMTLMAHINYLTQHIRSMATERIPKTNSEQTTIAAKEIDVTHVAEVEDSEDTDGGVTDPERPHLKFISKPPPEWTQLRNNDEDTESDTSDYDSEGDTSNSNHEDDANGGGASVPVIASSTSGPERGVMLSFPHMELLGIELLQVANLSLTVKCDRCKFEVDFQNIKPSTDSNIVRRTELCVKCSTTLTIQFRAEPMHVNSSKSGFLDLEGCSIIVDMLPSSFVPTCSECSNAATAVVSVRGETSLIVCRTCHNKLSFRIPEVKFLRVSATSSGSLPLRQQKQKESLGLSTGTQLPSHGNCKHYSKSYRWFRFSCCNRVYPCDRCHDADTNHPNEYAERMICGWCSREQRYRPEDCRFCGKHVIKKTNTRGFWEGGKGTRERGLMRRKEKRKFKRNNKGT